MMSSSGVFQSNPEANKTKKKKKRIHKTCDVWEKLKGLPEGQKLAIINFTQITGVVLTDIMSFKKSDHLKCHDYS